MLPTDGTEKGYAMSAITVAVTGTTCSCCADLTHPAISSAREVETSSEP
ncbi:hypothetical protein [Nocardia inohanensis]|nr:hypothetical protein [Nocardia inohanensis]